MDLQPRIEAPTDPVPNPAPPGGLLSRLFTNQNDVPRLAILDLQAKHITDYVNRLACLYLYSRLQNGVLEVPRREVYALIQATGINHTNYAPALSTNRSLSKKGGRKSGVFSLNGAGEMEARRYLSQIENADGEGEWYPGKERIPTLGSRRRRAGTRSGDGKDAESPASVVWTADAQKLRDAVTARYSEVSKWPIDQLALLGLYLVRKQYGPEHDVSYIRVTQLLYSAFELHTKEQGIRRALEHGRDAEEKHINPGAAGQGYRITPLGVTRVEELLAGERSETTPPETPEPQPTLFGEDSRSSGATE